MEIKNFTRLAAFLLFMLPLFSQALQIDFGTSSIIPIHWLFVIQAGIGAGLATIAGYIRDMFKDHEDILNQNIADLNNQIEVTKRDQAITERDIVINSYILNEKWLSQNQNIKNSTELLDKLKAQGKNQTPEEPKPKIG